MILRNLPLQSGNTVTLVLNSNFAISSDSKGCVITDGLHNNGGWKIAMSYDDMMKMFEEIEGVQNEHNK